MGGGCLTECRRRCPRRREALVLPVRSSAAHGELEHSIPERFLKGRNGVKCLTKKDFARFSINTHGSRFATGCEPRKRRQSAQNFSSNTNFRFRSYCRSQSNRPLIASATPCSSRFGTLTTIPALFPSPWEKRAGKLTTSLKLYNLTTNTQMREHERTRE